MSWAFGSWQDFLKKKACRYILQHYLGQFLKEKLSLDQLSLDLYNGMGRISELNLDVQAINEDLRTLGIPVELVDGFVDSIAVSIPWSSLIQDSTKLDVKGLELTLQPKQRDETGMMAGEMFSSMQSSMTTSLQLAKECLESEKGESNYKPEPIEGVQKFAHMIDSVLSKIRVSLQDTVIRLEHHPKGSPKGVAMEIRIKSIEYFDDMATATEGTPVDGKWEPAAISQKNFHIDGIQIYFDEITTRRAGSRSRSSSEESQMFTSSQSTFSTSGSADQYTASYPHSPGADGPSIESFPIQIAVLTGRQDIKLKTKQNDTLHGPKLEILCQLGGLHILLSPCQLHGILELVTGLTSPVSSDEHTERGSRVKNKPMEDMDFRRVEEDLQHQLQYGRIKSNNLVQMQDYSLHGDDEDHFYSLMSPKQGSSDMESSFSSNLSGTSYRTNSTEPSVSGHVRTPNKGLRDPFAPPKYHEDPSAEVSHYQLRVAFVSLTLFHNNPVPTADDMSQTQTEVMKDISKKFFQRVAGVTVAGMTELKEIRKQFASLVNLDHLRVLGRPFNIECNQKSALKQLNTSMHVTIGVAELVENLYGSRAQQSTPEFNEILTFRKDGSEKKKSVMYSSLHGGTPCFSMDIKSVSCQKPSARQSGGPRTDVSVNLGEFQTEIDLTLVDRINTLITPQTVISQSPLAGASMYHTVGQQQYYSLTTTLEEGPSGQQQPISLQVCSPLARLNLRFPIPDLRQESHVDKSWYQRNLREDVLTIDLEEMRVQAAFVTNQPFEQVQLTCSDINGYFKFQKNGEEHHFAHARGDGGQEGFNNPSMTIRFCSNTTSVLDEEEFFNEDTTPGDSLNGACEFARCEPSPFSSRRIMHNKEQESDKTEEKTEQMVLPVDRDELSEFMSKSISNTQLVVDINLPNACVFLRDKHFFEVLYNRLNNDLLLWEPSAPAPVTVMKENFSMPQNLDLNVYDQLLHRGDQFEMAKSGLQLDSDSDSDSEGMNHYSIHDSRFPRKKKSPRQQQSKLCLSLNIGKGRLTAFTDAKDPTGAALEDKHGEVLVQMSDLILFTVSAHNGDPNLQYLNVLVNRADLYHQACVDNRELLPLVDCGELSAPVPHHLQSNKVIYRSEGGVLVNTREDIGQGTDSMDMVSVALKIKLDTMASKCDLTSDEKVKEFLVSVGLRGATMRHKIAPPYQNVLTQMMDFLDVKDYPILGYVDPKVLTELHVHLWTCAIDYRPRHLPLKALVLADSFSISSNIVAESAVSLLRFVLDDGALFLSKKIKTQRTDLRKDYVCVTDIGRLELLLRSSDGKDSRYPKTDLRFSTNRINVRTCSDSCTELINLIQYLAADGDLIDLDLGADGQSEGEADLSGNTDDLDPGEELGEAMGMNPLSASSLDHVHHLMSEAMQESSESDESGADGSPTSSYRDLKQTEVFFVPVTGQGNSDSPLSRQPIILTQNIDSVTSSTASGFTDSYHSDEENSDDFCIIDDAAWGKAPKDGQPSIRIFIDKSVEIKDNYFSKPIGRTDLLKAPEYFPPPENRYTLKELTIVWHIYGGSDFSSVDCYNTGGDRVAADMGREGLSVSYHRGGSPSDRWLGHAAGREVSLVPRETLLTKGGPGRDHCKCMELQLTKMRFQHETYPSSAEQATWQVLLISDIEIRDKLKSSKINKFLYQYSSEDMPRQTYANMVHVRALHRRPNPNLPEEEECSLKVSLQPIRLNIDQDTLFFIKSFIMDVACVETKEGSSAPEGVSPPSRTNTSTPPPPPVMTVNKPEVREASPDAQDLLMQFDEFTQDLQASLRDSLSSSAHSNRVGARQGGDTASTTSSNTVVSDTTRSSQPVFFKSFVFTPDVPIRLDYHGKFDREHGALAGLGGLVSLNRSELKLKHITYKQGLLGTERLISYCLNEWLTDIKVNQLPNILGGFGPMHSFVQLAHGLKDLFWLPVEQYRKDGRIVRGLQRGATSFSMSTAMSVLELTNRVVQSVQWCAELTFDMVSPGPRRRGYYPRQPADLREGVTNAYIVLREGFSETANTIVEAATKEHGSKGMMGAVGGVIRQIPPTIVQPLIIVPEATSNLIGGLRSQLKPDVKKEDEEKWKEEIID